MSSARPVLIVLAAWSAERLGQGHTLTRALGPRAVLLTTLHHAQASGLPVLLVTTPELGGEARGILGWGDMVIVPGQNQQRTISEGYAIAMGVSARSNAPGWVLLPGDMPLVQPSTMQAVADGLSHGPVCLAQHEGRDGRPVAFSAELYSDLIRLDSDEGTRRLQMRYPAHRVGVDDPGVLLDLDEIDDFDLLRRSAGVPDNLTMPWQSDLPGSYKS
ncbi:MAG: nucleotidyltransferase family protein [Aquabacterium sp.]|nr:MAG: nucleotidyltransferase family protein [Aquabacterium sp.]